MRPYRLLAASHLHLDRIIDADEVLDVGEETGADEDFATTSLGLQTLRHIDHIAHYRIFHTLLRANIAYNGFAAVNADTQMQRELTPAATYRVECRDSTLNIQGCLDGTPRMVYLFQGCTKQGEKDITEEFIECDLVHEQHVQHELQVLVEDVDHRFWLMPLSEGRKVAYIREEHRHLPAHTAQGAQVRVREHLCYDLLTQVATQSLTQNFCFGDVVN